MSEGEKTRLIAWANELRAVHGRLRAALKMAQDAVASGAPAEVASRDLLLFCHGFCVALNGHHEGEDRTLFPALSAAHPELRETISKLRQDHSMIGHLLGGLQAAVSSGATTTTMASHLEGIAAIMESHFRYEERELLDVLDGFILDADPAEVFGPL
ncbi:cation-binding protein [Microbacterium sp. SZ1]|uniref:hemerythrin domain-containing protein n=1 Tax=Microbacterium sp. SZ1 TaxID=1849736 RepID=UPI000BBC7453|nr:hemerythrin domain-containing protein [Microbacterium sp. SZ1]PCE15571.1 cation-binding protein [Microbacterium sp. SZ1]